MPGHEAADLSQGAYRGLAGVIMASLSAQGLPKMIMLAAHLTVREAEQRMDDLLLIPYEVPFRPP
jgi:hypothetical protein